MARKKIGPTTTKPKPRNVKRPTKRKARAKSPAIGSLRVESIAVSRLNPAAYNPRRDLQPGDPDYEKLKRSIETFGYVDPLIWNKRTSCLIGGHQRLKVLVNEHGLQPADKVDVSVVDLPLAKEKALNVALNKIAGSWDDAGLAALLTELRDLDDIDETTTGFEGAEIEEMLNGVLEGDGGGEVAPGPPEIWQVVVNTASESAQKRLYDRLTKDGFSCRVATL